LGATLPLGGKRGLFYALAIGEAELDNDFRRGYRYGPRLTMAAVSKIFERNKMKLEANHHWDIDQNERASFYRDYRIDFSHSVSRNFEVRLGARRVESDSLLKPYDEMKLMLHQYLN
jgi:hypothetical protein